MALCLPLDLIGICTEAMARIENDYVTLPDPKEVIRATYLDICMQRTFGN